MSKLFRKTWSSLRSTLENRPGSVRCFKRSFAQEDLGEPDNLVDLMPRLLGGEMGPGPTPGHLVHALTLAAAGDRFSRD